MEPLRWNLQLPCSIMVKGFLKDSRFFFFFVGKKEKKKKVHFSKALRSSSGRCVLFRPEKNAERAAAGCDRLLMPKISSEVFLDGVIQTARANSHWIPPNGQGSLYLRPIIFGSGAGLGVAASEWFHFVVFASPVGSYFKSGAGSGVALEVSETFHRAAPKGVGNVKSISNYAPAYQAQAAAKKRGFSDALFLDTTDTNVEEAGAANFFVVDKSGVVRTPSLGSILPGVTRDAVLTLARDLGFKVREGPLPIAEVMEAQEAWCTGTAAVISPVASVTYKGNKKEFAAPNVSKKIHKLFDDILEGREKDTHKWIVNLF
jgi:branched-chain amino acid aminotransferase group II